MRILITTDGSDFSLAAVEKCCEMVVKPEETAIKIVSVYELALPLDIPDRDLFAKTSAPHSGSNAGQISMEICAFRGVLVEEVKIQFIKTRGIWRFPS